MTLTVNYIRVIFSNLIAAGTSFFLLTKTAYKEEGKAGLDTYKEEIIQNRYWHCIVLMPPCKLHCSKYPQIFLSANINLSRYQQVYFIYISQTIIIMIKHFSIATHCQAILSKWIKIGIQIRNKIILSKKNQIHFIYIYDTIHFFICRFHYKGFGQKVE